jgi:hypothetical protein
LRPGKNLDLPQPANLRVPGRAIATGAEMRQALGTAVFFGMLGVTLFGLLFAPVFYVTVHGSSNGEQGFRRRRDRYQRSGAP